MFTLIIGHSHIFRVSTCKLLGTESPQLARLQNMRLRDEVVAAPTLNFISASHYQLPQPRDLCLLSPLRRSVCPLSIYSSLVRSRPSGYERPSASLTAVAGPTAVTHDKLIH